MNEPGFYQFQPHHHHHLDPSAQEFFPSLPLIPHQIYYPYHPSYPTPFCSPAYVSTDPSPPVPLSLPPPCSTPSRALVLSLIPADVSESMLRNELEVYGDVRAVQMEKLRRDGIVTVHFYDLRHAQTALVEIQEQHMQHQFRLKMHYDAVLLNNNNSLANLLPPPLPPPARGLIRGRAVWAQFTFPVTHDLPDGFNQGTLVIFNLDPLVSASSLQQIFEAFGPVKELRHAPTKKNQRFVEFYDTRDAAKALAEMNGKEINGKRIMIEFSRPGGHGRLFSPPPQPPPLQHKTLAKRSSFAKSPGGNGGDDKCNSNGGGSLQRSIASLCISAKGSCEESCKIKHSKKITKKCNSNSNGGCGGGALKQHQAKSSRLWKGSRQVKEYDPLFVINEDAIMGSDCKDSRTTVMIKNIPNKYSLKLLLNLLDNHCISTKKQIGGGDDQPLSSYDFVYLPIDFINKCNVGYAFVNMTSPEATWRLYKAFHLQSWEVFNSRKICEVTYARLQGVEAMREHFKNSKFPCDEEDYMPVVFSPPRNGRQLTEPLPIVGGPSYHPPPLLLSSSSAVSCNQDQSEDSSDKNNNNNAAAADGDDNMDGQDLPEQVVEQLEVNEAAEHIDDGVGGGRDSGGDSRDHYDNDDVDCERQP